MAKKLDSKGAARGMARERTLTILVPIISVLLALVVGGIVIACLGKNPIQGYALLFSGSLGTPQKFASSSSRRSRPPLRTAAASSTSAARASSSWAPSPPSCSCW